MGIVGIPTGMHNLAHVFLAGQMDHYCRLPIKTNVSAKFKQDLLPREVRDGGKTYSQCSMYEQNYSSLVFVNTLVQTGVNGLGIGNATTATFTTPYNPSYDFSNLSVTECSQWEYDTSQFASTIVSQVCMNH